MHLGISLHEFFDSQAMGMGYSPKGLFTLNFVFCRRTKLPRGRCRQRRGDLERLADLDGIAFNIRIVTENFSHRHSVLLGNLIEGFARLYDMLPRGHLSLPTGHTETEKGQRKGKEESEKSHFHWFDALFSRAKIHKIYSLTEYLKIIPYF